jgi:hypothetical protein
MPGIPSGGAADVPRRHRFQNNNAMSENPPPDSFCLSTGAVTPMEDALVLGKGLPTEIGSIPCRYFWREMIRVGDFVHPGQNDRPISVTAGTLKHWQDQFSRMKQNGVRVYVPVDHKKGTPHNRGYVEEVRVRDGKLEGLLQLIGDDAVRDCARSEISIKVDKVKDGKGNVYPSAIEHASLVVDPVIPGATTYEAHDPEQPALAASRGQDGSVDPVATYVLSVSHRKEADMRLTPEQAAKVKALVGSDVSEDSAFDTLLTFAESSKQEAATALSRATTAEDALAVTKVELSRATAAPKPTARELRDAGRNAARARQDAIASGALTPATADKIEKRFLPGGKVDPDALVLSRTVEDGDGLLLSRLDTVADVFESLVGNVPPPKYGEHSGVQFSRHAVEPDQADDAAKAGLDQGKAYRDAQLAARGLTA